MPIDRHRAVITTVRAERDHAVSYDEKVSYKMALSIKTDLTPLNTPRGYEVRAEGVFFQDGPNSQSPKRQLTTVAAGVSSVTRTLTGKFWCVTVTWRDHDGNVKSQSLDYTSLLNRSGSLEDLAAGGLFILPGAVPQFALYLSLCAAMPGVPRYRTHHSLGLFAWPRNDVDGVLHFLLGDRCLIPASLRTSAPHLLEDQWQDPLNAETAADGEVPTPDTQFDQPEAEMAEVEGRAVPPALPDQGCGMLHIVRHA